MLLRLDFLVVLKLKIGLSSSSPSRLTSLLKCLCDWIFYLFWNLRLDCRHFHLLDSQVYLNVSVVGLFEICLWFLTYFQTMAEVFCFCGQWSSKESFQWEFNVDKNRNASFIYIEDLQYKDLMKMVFKDFSFKEK